MLTVSTPPFTLAEVTVKRRTYHHGDLRRALMDETTRTIRKEGVEAVTLRAIGRRLGVSRTALYRHFSDKSALLAAVAREGFQRFTRDLLAAWTGAGGGATGLQAMGAAYVRFAIANPSHYRVMFGGFKELGGQDPELETEATASFNVLLDAIVALQRDRILAPDEPLVLAHYIWATVHGIAMLAIDGQLGPDPGAAETLVRYALGRLAIGIAASA
jgi:AcrR family transcriptional regulator